MKSKRIKVPLYGGSLTIYQVDELKVIEDKYDLEDTYGYDALVFETHNKHDVINYVIAFENETTPSNVAHEALHMTNRICKSAGIVVGSDNDEPQAYLIGWIVKQCHSFLKFEDEE